jgi:hypothetical protein
LKNPVSDTFLNRTLSIICGTGHGWKIPGSPHTRFRGVSGMRHGVVISKGIPEYGLRQNQAWPTRYGHREKMVQHCPAESSAITN